MDATAVKLVQDFYVDEITDNVSYQALADRERNPRLREVLAGAAKTELRHSGFWKRYLERQQSSVPAARGRRLRRLVLGALQKVFNPVLLVAALELGESRAIKAYHHCLKTFDFDETEKAGLRSIILEEIEHEVTFRNESEKLGLTHVRDFVLGMNDGLIEVLGVVMGLSAVYVGKPWVVAVSGLVVGIAGALSMGIGAFISVRSQRQVNLGSRQRAQVLFDVAPDRAVDEYRAKLIDSGVPSEAAADIATHVGSNHDAIARLLLAEDHENEVRSGAFTALAYLGGAFPPLVPYFFASSATSALLWAAAFAAVALVAVAAVISTFSGISLRQKAVEMVVSAAIAAGLSFAFGVMLQRLTGVSV